MGIAFGPRAVCLLLLLRSASTGASAFRFTDAG